ncbi:MAG: hypothetical protein OXM03_13415 [Chloroflexota bacterium]|nr:hypothetical protein [Chloroflexota bacterium]MDE2841620.1 hypothetical protein [Chloroflexota bacterium]MDE2931188.1 hypothetical protein [Chloroflexota bacterium]
MQDTPWVALVGPFPLEIRPGSRWRDRYQRMPLTIRADGLAEALASPTLDSVILHWNLPDRLSLAQSVLESDRPLCLPGPLTLEEKQLLRSANRSPLLGGPSSALPAVRAMRLALGDENTGPVRYVAVRRLSQPAPAALHYAPLADALETAFSFMEEDPEWVFAQRAERAEATSIIANLHFPSAEVMATWVQVPGGPAHDDWLLYGTKGMVHQRDEHADHTMAAHLFDHWLSVRGGRDELLLHPMQALIAARLAQAIDRSLHERRRVAWQEVAKRG